MQTLNSCAVLILSGFDIYLTVYCKESSRCLTSEINESEEKQNSNQKILKHIHPTFEVQSALDSCMTNVLNPDLLDIL